MPHKLIDLTKWPSMPSPFNSSDPGEAWVWGEYVALLQASPVVVAEMLMKMTGQKSVGVPPIRYPYAMTVFYRKDRNPHGPSSRPILVATLEQMDYAAAARMMGTQVINSSNIRMQHGAPVVQGFFTAETHFNLGDFDGALTRDSARRYFLNFVKRHLSLEGEPVKIGSIADVHGHPDTGWPGQEKNKVAKPAVGRTQALAESRRTLWTALLCLLMFGALVALIGLEFVRANELIRNGSPTVATAIANSEAVRGRKGRISYSTPIVLDGIQTSVRLNFPVSAGQRFRIIYNATDLAQWASHRKGWFYSFMVGDTAMSPSELVEQKFADTYTLGRWVILAFGTGGVYFFFSYFRERKHAVDRNTGS